MNTIILLAFIFVCSIIMGLGFYASHKIVEAIQAFIEKKTRDE